MRCDVCAPPCWRQPSDDVGDPNGPDASVVGLEVGGEPRAGDVAVELLGTFAAKKVEDETVEEFEEVRRREDGESELGSPPPAVVWPSYHFGTIIFRRTV